MGLGVRAALRLAEDGDGGEGVCAAVPERSQRNGARAAGGGRRGSRADGPTPRNGGHYLLASRYVRIQ